MAPLKWEDPPGVGRTSSATYAADIEELKQNPGEWALVKEVWRTNHAPAAFVQRATLAW